MGGYVTVGHIKSYILPELTLSTSSSQAGQTVSTADYLISSVTMVLGALLMWLFSTEVLGMFS